MDLRAVYFILFILNFILIKKSLQFKINLTHKSTYYYLEMNIYFLLL